jgi:hypothetical protein
MRSFCVALPLPLALLLLLACSGPNGNELFAKNSVTTAGAGAGGGTFTAAAGTGSTSGQSQTQGGAGPSEATGGSSSSGASMSLGGSSMPSGGSGGSGGQVAIPPPVIESCEMLDGAVTNDESGNCYRINADKLTFGDAREACIAIGGHLVTVSSESEDAFVHGLLDEEHWLGATDARANGMAGVAPYTWVNGDEWGYSNWEDGQPNAVATNCPGENSGAKCFEHCAYQDDSGGWNDRACWHTIASICEWDIGIE